MNEQVLISIKGMQIGRDTGAESISSEHEGRYFV